VKTIQVRLPDAIHGKVRQLAKDEQMSLNQFMVTSVSNEVVRHETSDFFREAAAHFSAEAFDEALRAVADVAADKEDRILSRKVAETQGSYKTRRKS
jgi:predicted transcriptional regulator